MPGGFHPPPSVIAAWPKPNYTDPEAKGSELLVVSIVFTVLSSVAVVARLWVRLRHKNQAGADDVILGLCMVGSRLHMRFSRYKKILTRILLDPDPWNCRPFGVEYAALELLRHCAY